MRACPSCFTRVPVGEVTCPACGRALGTVGAPSRPLAAPPDGPERTSGPPVAPPSGWVETLAPGARGRRDDHGRGFETLTPLGLEGDPVAAVDDQRVEVGAGDDAAAGARPSGGRRRRSLVGVLAAAAVVAVTAAGVQAVLGGAGEAGTNSAPPTTAEPTTTAPVAPTTAPALPDPRADEIGSPRRHRVLPTRTDTLAVLATDGGLVAVDLDNGRTRPLTTDFTSGRFTNGQLTTDDHVVVADREQVQAVPLDGGPVVSLGSGCAAFASGDPAVVWIASCDPAVAPRAVEVASGVERPEQLPLPAAAELVGRAPSGLVVQGPSGIYLADGGQSRKVADGQVLAVVGDRVVRAVCDDQLACSLSAVDLATGTEQGLDAPPEALAAVKFRLPPFGPQVSPDQQRVAVTLFDYGQTSVYMVDLAAGTVSLVPGAESRLGAPLAWSSDGQWLLFQPDGGPVQAWRPSLGDAAVPTSGLPDGRLLGTFPDDDAARPVVGAALRDP